MGLFRDVDLKQKYSSHGDSQQTPLRSIGVHKCLLTVSHPLFECVHVHVHGVTYIGPLRFVHADTVVQQQWRKGGFQGR